MDINQRFSSNAIDTIKDIIDSFDGKSSYFRGIPDEDGVITNIKHINFSDKIRSANKIISQMSDGEVIIKNSKSKHLFPSDNDLDIAEKFSEKFSGGYYIINREATDLYVVSDNLIEEDIHIDIEKLFDTTGNLSESLYDFEFRKEQLKMATTIQEAINENRTCIIEAGTGTGKSLAYLIPSIKWAVANKKKVIIATNTINLQEQLLYKDIPIVKEVIEENFNYALIKGRNNYLCKREFMNIYKGGRINVSEFSDNQKQQLEKVLAWGINTVNGDKSELDFEVDYEIWETMQSTTELCIGKRCKFRDECYFFKARKEKIKADVLIANYHIFFSDLKLRTESEFDADYLILPKYDLVVFDEAHNIPSTARNYFSVSVSKFGFLKIMNQLKEDKNKVRKRKVRPILDLLIDSLNESEFTRDSEFYGIIEDIDILHIKTLESSRIFFDELIFIFAKNSQTNITKTLKRDEMLNSPFMSELRKHRDIFIENSTSYFKLLTRLGKKLNGILDTNEYAANFIKHVDKIENFILSFKMVNNFSDEDFVYWTEINPKFQNSSLLATPINIDEILDDSLFSNLSRIVFTSATLSVNNNFEYFKESIGLKGEVSEEIISSVFDYEKQTNVYIPSDIVGSEAGFKFNDAVSEFLIKLLIKTKGKAFILFTSYQILNHVYYSIKNELKKHNINLLLHGEKPRTQLINEFKTLENPVLLGTNSFWEGVDIKGEQLSNVVIVKLPFLVPTDPIVSAISAKLEASNKNSFMDFQIPEAVIKFKQGIGRLIRSKTDTGNIIILDNRIIKKRYGKYFLNSIPSSNINIKPMQEILNMIK